MSKLTRITIMSLMEHVLTTEYIKDMVLDNLTIKELNHIRACSKGLQTVVSEYSEQQMNRYLDIINRKITQLCPDKMTTIYDTPYIVIYNYYHAIIKYSFLTLGTHTGLHKLMRRLHDKKVLHRGYKYVLDTDRYIKLDTSVRNYSLFDIMTVIYLCNTGSGWASYHWSGDELDEMKYIQGKLLPLS